MKEVKAKWPFQDSYRVGFIAADGTKGAYVVEAGSHAHAIQLVKEAEPDARSVLAVKKEV